MSQATANLALPLIAAAQASKHVTHNEALTALDSLVQLACLDKDLAAPPAGPREGDRYLVVTPSPAGPWAGLSGQVVRYQDGSWIGFAPKAGWFCWVVDEGDLYTFDGTAWIGFRATLTAFQNLARLGVGTTADAGNPFAAKLNAALWTALGTGEGGTGDLRYTLNKEAAARTLSLLMQTGFSGRAEIGLTGDDDLHVKVSANGSAFLEALRVNRSNGTLAHVAGTAAAPALTPAGDANTGVFSPGADAWAVATGGIERLRVGSNGRLGLGTATPRSTLDTGLGTLTGAANDYGQAQTTLSGGGSVSWGGAGGRLRWTGRFLAMPMSRPTAQNGYIAITQPTTDIPAAQCWDNLARTADPTGIVLTPWDALYAVHPPGGTASSVTLWVVNYASAFVAPSNWLLVAAHNGDDNTIKLGTGAILRAGGTATAGTDAHYAPRLPSPDNTLNLGGPANRYALCGHRRHQHLRRPREITPGAAVRGGDRGLGGAGQADRHLPLPRGGPPQGSGRAAPRRADRPGGDRRPRGPRARPLRVRLHLPRRARPRPGGIGRDRGGGRRPLRLSQRRAAAVPGPGLRGAAHGPRGGVSDRTGAGPGSGTARTPSAPPATRSSRR
ncbi:hypothetical protein ASG40_04080 [Methylobacterium sp. Leaf399]|nr:DUF2793 domain-containing protein [Methylobacterium sp. Leaf399]KQT19985.1 hypothetical protein ASG40_04080 [Methylobacterium sp. Leaf399]